MIKLTNVEKSYELGGETFEILKGINLTITEGEYTSILGASGSGKSTLMHIIGLLDQPTSGQVFLDDMDVSKLTDDQMSKMRNEYVGFVFQQFNLINKLTVLENVLLPTIYGNHKKVRDYEEKAKELLSEFGLSERAEFYPNKISGGQQQRVAIARALVMNPKLILADEPTGNLDSKTGDEILKLLEELNKKYGVTVVLVTHDKNVAKRTNRQIYIKDGVIKI